MRHKMTQTVLSVWLVTLLGVILACAATATSMTVEGTPRAVCPSSTPKPTHTDLPPDPPVYPSAIQVTLDYAFVDPSRSYVTLQYLAQHVGTVSVVAPGAGPAVVASTGPGPGVTGRYTVYIPAWVTSGVVQVYSAAGVISLPVVRYAVVVVAAPTPPPCCLPAPVFPTPRPTYTPWPTPTPYVVEPPQDFYLGMPVRNDSGPVRLRLVLKSVTEKSFPVLPLVTAATWELDIANVGALEFDFIGSLQTYVSQVAWAGATIDGVWSPSHLAAEFMGIVEQAYTPVALLPGRTITVRVAAWIPSGAHATKVSFILNPYHAGDPGYATFVPGQERLLTWRNQTDSGCPAW